ncbi:MAG: heat shock protein HspQ [Candidatus Omnitrophica bacterium]|nr:heat shock protein HspQ [Candidatus Omnitrophota bacterium]
MLDIKQLPFIIYLLDDESRDVQRELFEQLKGYGSGLREEILKLPVELVQPRADVIDKFFRGQDREGLKGVWYKIFDIKDELGQLEWGLTRLAEYQTGFKYHLSENVKDMLDRLADEYRAQYEKIDALELARFLFVIKNIRGAQTDYYNPQNCNLHYVINQKRGVPISLVGLYILIGSRLGLDIKGFNFPGHFMAWTKYNDRMILIDCYHEGKVVEEKEIVFLNGGKDNSKIEERKIDAVSLLSRLLSNLIHAYKSQDDTVNQELIVELFKEVDHRCHPEEYASEITVMDTNELNKISNGPLYSPGEIVRHRRYGYRGLVVDYDLQCEASDAWYLGNQSQPEREQPWYRVLVHESQQVTYSAENNLMTDKAPLTVNHPLVEYFFARTNDGKYVRNNNPWPK